MKKILIAGLFVLILMGAGLALWALTSNAGDTGHSGAVSRQSVRHHKVAIVNLPPIQKVVTTTTSTTTVATTTTVAAIKTVTPVTTQAKVTEPTTLTTTTVPIVVKAVAPSTSPTNESNVIVQASATGTMTAPDKTECTAGADQECVLVTTTLVTGNLSTFAVMSSSGGVVGTLIAKGYGQSYCLIHWLSRTNGTVASSPDCSGSPLTSTQIVINFSYSAS